jgi:phenylpropionate dioxygenase-like ring-hydroxylating dioxygenase large terminal subunit
VDGSAKGTLEQRMRDESAGWRPKPTLAGREYCDEDVWRDERDRIWHSTWVAVGRAEEVPETGSYQTYDVAGESVFVTRNADGALHGFYNVCSHRGTRFLDEGGGTVKKAFKCPYHGWTYGLNGELLGTPNVEEDEFFDRADYPLHPIHVDTYAGFLFVNLSTGRPMPLLEFLRSGAETMTAFERFAMQDLRIGHRIVYEVRANWKILVENYNECLHCPTIHPELVQVVPLFRFGEVWDEDIRDDGLQMREGATSFNPTGVSTLPRFAGILDEDVNRYYGIYQFPNIALDLHPDCVQYYVLVPRSPSHTTVISDYLFMPETIAERDVSAEPVVEFWDLISKQDWAVCERAQVGVRSRAYTTGIYPRKDRFLYWFNEEYRQWMGRPSMS